MNPEKELTGTEEKIAQEIANMSVKMPSYIPDENKFKSIVEWMSYNPNGTYEDYKNEMLTIELEEIDRQIRKNS